MPPTTRPVTLANLQTLFVDMDVLVGDSGLCAYGEHGEYFVVGDNGSLRITNQTSGRAYPLSGQATSYLKQKYDL